MNMLRVLTVPLSHTFLLYLDAVKICLELVHMALMGLSWPLISPMGVKLSTFHTFSMPPLQALSSIGRPGTYAKAHTQSLWALGICCEERARHLSCNNMLQKVTWGYVMFFPTVCCTELFWPLIRILTWFPRVLLLALLGLFHLPLDHLPLPVYWSQCTPIYGCHNVLCFPVSSSWSLVPFSYFLLLFKYLISVICFYQWV